jgi:predicted GNAT family acetyltransferase
MEAASDDRIDVRPMSAEDAAGVAELVRSTYGDDYVHGEIYQPERFFAAQERGEHISEVAVTPDGRVVAHWAFTFHGPRVAESGMTITHSDFRGHGIATDLERNLLRRLDELGVRWVMGEAVLYHTASQEIVIAHWHRGAITGFRVKAFHPVAAVGGFDESLEHGRFSAATAFSPMASMVEREIWVADAYRSVLSQVLSMTDWPRRISEGQGRSANGESSLHVTWDEINSSATIEVVAIGADLEHVVRAERDQAVARGAQYVDLRLPVSSPESAQVDLMDLGFSYAAFLPEMGEDCDLLLLQWLPDPVVDRQHWKLINAAVESLADAVIGQAREAFERRPSRPSGPTN